MGPLPEQGAERQPFLIWRGQSWREPADVARVGAEFGSGPICPGQRDPERCRCSPEWSGLGAQ